MTFDYLDTFIGYELGYTDSDQPRVAKYKAIVNSIHQADNYTLSFTYTGLFDRKPGPYDGIAMLDNVILLPPLGYRNFVALMNHAKLILTDSGGVQEEAPSLGKPVLVMRENTDFERGVSGMGSALGRSSIVTQIEEEDEVFMDVPSPKGSKEEYSYTDCESSTYQKKSGCLCFGGRKKTKDASK